MFRSIFYTTVLFAAAAYPAAADEWSKTFQTGGAPELHVETNDANVTVRTGSGTAIEARVFTTGWRIGPGEVHVSEHQTGGRVDLEVKAPPMHFNLGSLGNRSIKIELQVPADTKADIHTSDGNIRADGLRGKSRLVTHDGNIDGEGFDGALEATSGDGNIKVRGKFQGLDLRSGDGNIEAEVRPGSRMAGGWTVHSGDGNVTLRLPEDLAANVEAHTGDGHITVDVPLAGSGGPDKNSVSGKLSGGGPTLTIHTGDGSIHLARL